MKKKANENIDVFSGPAAIPQDFFGGIALLSNNYPFTRGTAAAVPPPFRPGNPAFCGSRPLVTPYYFRLGDLLCVVRVVSFYSVYYFVFVCVFCCLIFLRFSFVAFPSVL